MMGLKCVCLCDDGVCNSVSMLVIKSVAIAHTYMHPWDYHTCLQDSILNGRIASVQLAMLLNTVSGAQPKSVMAIPQRVPVETFSIRLDYLAPSDGPWDVSQMTRMKFSKILDNFRAAVLRVEGVSGILPERNDGISFEIRVAMRERDPVLQSLWVPVQEGEESIVHTTKIERNTEPMHTETPNEPAAHGVMTTSTTAMSDATPSQLAPVRSFKLSEKCQLHCFFECIS